MYNRFFVRNSYELAEFVIPKTRIKANIEIGLTLHVLKYELLNSSPATYSTIRWFLFCVRRLVKIWNGVALNTFLSFLRLYFYIIIVVVAVVVVVVDINWRLNQIGRMT